MDLGLNNKVAIIGGGSKGLGRTCADVLAAEGAKIVICSRNQANLDQAAQEIRDATDVDVLAFTGDLDHNETIVNLVKATIDHFGHIDILVNNSGGPPLGEAASASEEDWHIAIERSLLYFARMCRETVPHMQAQASGSIINVLSNSVYTPIFNLALSGATRMGVVAYAKSLADEVGKYNIRVNNVAPGSILTERMISNITSKARIQGMSDDAAIQQRAAGAALKRLGKPEELANVVAFLASDKASYITGTTLRIDGGSARAVL
jgi:3-oxoacyl-[acyl-carrier protein] reductase